MGDVVENLHFSSPPLIFRIAFSLTAMQTSTVMLALQQSPEWLYDGGPKSIHSHLSRQAALLEMLVNGRCIFSTTLYMKLEVEQTPKGEVEKNYLVCYPTWGKKKPPVRIE